ncbi:MAG: hypothetical protein B6243_12460 [Anaerolineaceae bacterium 4572_5.2]|nr:MAG: hypothetical protein B6243_12460 [Anaerolineaceae bacterium 4572_5.2]
MNQDFERLVGRAVVDKEFRDALLANPENAVTEAGFMLNDEEVGQLKAGIEKVRAELGSDRLDEMFKVTKGAWY